MLSNRTTHSLLSWPILTDGDVHTPAWDYHGGKQPNIPVSNPGKEPSISTRPRPSASKPYSKVIPAALPKESRTVCKDEVVTGALMYPTTTKLTNPLGPLGPPNYVVVPQITFPWGRMPALASRPSRFMPKGRRELWINLAQGLSERPAIENSDDKSGARHPRGQGQVSGFPFETRIRTRDGNITRGELLNELCSAVVEFVLMSKKEESANVSKGYARWKIGSRDLKADMFFITGLIHRGGNYFQPEIWAPRRSKDSERGRVASCT